MPTSSSKFLLDKIYFDCIDPRGNCFVIYWAQLKLNIFRFHYTGFIFSDAEGMVTEKISLRKIQRPEVNEIAIFLNDKLNLSGKWDTTSPGLQDVLYTKDEKKILWHCHHPRANVDIHFMGKQFQGTGYAETLVLPFKPWKLPIDELRWGRFLSKNNTITWIQWKGNYHLNKVYHNGTLYEDGQFKEHLLTFNGGHFSVKFFQPVIIRKGKLSRVIARIPWLLAMVNHKILRTLEIKYKARATFIQDINAFDEGWALFEIVSWPGKNKVKTT